MSSVFVAFLKRKFPTKKFLGFIIFVVGALIGAGGVSAQFVGIESIAPGNPVGQSVADISSDGRFILFTTNGMYDARDTDPLDDIYIYDRATSTYELISVSSDGSTTGNGFSYGPALSPNGRYVVYASDSSNIEASDSDSTADLFLYDRTSGTTSRVSNDSSVGRTSVFYSTFLSNYYDVSDDGEVVYVTSTGVDPRDTNGALDVYFWDNGTHQLVSVSVDGLSATDGGVALASVSISADGQKIVYIDSTATNLVNDGGGAMYLYNRGTNSSMSLNRLPDSTLINDGMTSARPRISANGSFVMFESNADNIDSRATSGDGQVYLHDVSAGTFELVSVNSNGDIADGSAIFGGISDDGRYVVFQSTAQNLDDRDTDRGGAVPNRDVFVRDTGSEQTSLLAMADDQVTHANEGATNVVIASGGRYVIFLSAATNLDLADNIVGVSKIFAAENPTFDLPVVVTTEEVVTNTGGGGNGRGGINRRIVANQKVLVCLEEFSTEQNPANYRNGLIIQVFLFSRGFYTGEFHGIHTPLVSEAVRALQAAYYDKIIGVWQRKGDTYRPTGHVLWSTKYFINVELGCNPDPETLGSTGIQIDYEQ